MVADNWKAGFCLDYVDTETVSIRPSSETGADALEAYAQAPLKAMYISSLSGLDIEEAKWDNGVIRPRLARGQGGTVLRSMITEVSHDESKWAQLQQTIKDMFGGAELSRPSGEDPIHIQYRHSPKTPWYRLTNASAGFLQTVLVRSALLLSDTNLLLIDEPDAHLHALLKESMDRIIREHCDKTGCQALIATHSSLLIDAIGKEGRQNLFLVSAEGLRPVKRGQARDLLKIPFNEIVLAETTQRILYVEGRSDLKILRAWARVLNRPVADYLNNPFWVATAERPKRKNSKRNYRALKAQVPALQALEIRDRNGKNHKDWENLASGELRQEDKDKDKDKMPAGMQLVYWTRREIESYLLHPKALQRFLADRIGEGKAKEHIKDRFSPAVIRDPFEATDLLQMPGKKTIVNVFAGAGVDFKESECDKIADAMLPEEIHPDVVAMLDKIEAQLMDRNDTP